MSAASPDASPAAPAAEPSQPTGEQSLDLAGTYAAESGRPLLDDTLLAKIRRLDVRTQKQLQGRQKGEKRSKKRGRSVEFADHRMYAPGDDLRFLDWSIYARLDQLMVKLFQEEEDLYVYLLVDASASMDYGRPNKLRYALKVAAALGYIGLVNMNRVGIGTFAGGLERSFRPERGRRNVHKLIRFLEDTPAGGPTDLSAACRRFALENPRRGVIVILSDFMDKNGYEDAVRFFVARKMDVFCLQILSPQELDPPLAGDLQLIDVEDEEETEVTVSGSLLQSYKKTLASFLNELREFCHSRGARYMSASTALPPDKLIVEHLRRQGLVK